MSPLQRLFLVPFLCASASVLAQDLKGPKDLKEDPLPKPVEQDQTYLRKITDRIFVHEEAKISFTVPVGWKEIKPQRLRREIDPRISVVLRIEELEKDVMASLYWIPMNPGQKMSDWVRDSPKAVYGPPPKVSLPTKTRVGSFDVYRININGGPDRTEKYDGVLFLFEVKSGTTNWLIKARVSFPKGDRTQYDPYAMDVLRGYTMLPDGVGSEKK